MIIDLEFVFWQFFFRSLHHYFVLIIVLDLFTVIHCCITKNKTLTSYLFCFSFWWLLIKKYENWFDNKREIFLRMTIKANYINSRVAFSFLCNLFNCLFLDVDNQKQFRCRKNIFKMTWLTACHLSNCFMSI